MPLVTLIAAVSADGFISRDRGVPWDLPLDKQFFRDQTAGRWLLLGRTTYEEMTGWFQPGHVPLVLSRDAHFQPPAPGKRVTSVQEAVELATKGGAAELVVVGGSQAFVQAMPLADRLLITQVSTLLETGVSFPAIDPDVWTLESREPHPPDARHAFAFEFQTFIRMKTGATER